MYVLFQMPMHVADDYVYTKIECVFVLIMELRDSMSHHEDIKSAQPDFKFSLRPLRALYYKILCFCID